MSDPETLRIDKNPDGVVTVTLARPAVRNAFNAEVISELHAAFIGPCAADDVRAVLIRGEGKSFCAGADLNWMKASVELSLEENQQDAERMARMFEAIADCPAPVIAVVHGHALGGGAGLVAAADVAIVTTAAKLGFTEVVLGIVPAVISPFCVRKIGVAHALRYFATGEIFDGAEAARIGLAQKCVEPDALEGEVEALRAALLRAGPLASREAKRLAHEVDGRTPAACRDLTSHLIARLRGSEEGQEGMAAFLEKRAAAWVEQA